MICPYSHAKQAEAELTEVGATVNLETYEGGHGWHGDIYGHIRRGVNWLVEPSSRAKSPQ
jgi:predicted esterase